LDGLRCAYPGGYAGRERHGHGVHEAGGLDEHPRGADGGGGVGQVAGQHGDDLVPPPLEADADAAGHGEPGEPGQAAGDHGGSRPPLPRVVARARPADVGEQEEQHVGVGERLRGGDAADAESEAEDEEHVERDVERDGDRGAGRHGPGDPLGAEVHPERLEHDAGGEVREREARVGGGGGGDGGVLAERDEDGADVEPEQRDGQRGEEEQQHGALEGEGEEVVVAGAEGLRAERLEPGREAEEHAVARDVGEPDGERAAGEVQRAQAAEAEHGHQRAQVHHAVEGRDRRRHAPQRAELRRHRRLVVAAHLATLAVLPLERDGHANPTGAVTTASALCERGSRGGGLFLRLAGCLPGDIYGRLAAVAAVIACGLSLLISTRLSSHEP
jgi:hypothetical protein